MNLATLQVRGFMHGEELIRDGLLLTLAQCYEQDPSRYVTLPKETLDSSSARGLVAELRNEGYVEEQVRGVVRLTPRGYKVYKTDHLILAYEN
jgi:hypothetical protein